MNGRGRFNQEAMFYVQGQIIIGDNYNFGCRYGDGYHGALYEIQS